MLFCRLLTFFKINILKKILSGIPSVSNSLDPVQADILLGLIWVQTLCQWLSAEALVDKDPYGISQKLIHTEHI